MDGRSTTLPTLDLCQPANLSMLLLILTKDFKRASASYLPLWATSMVDCVVLSLYWSLALPTWYFDLPAVLSNVGLDFIQRQFLAAALAGHHYIPQQLLGKGPPTRPPSTVFPVYNLTRSPLTAALYYLNAWNRLWIGKNQCQVSDVSFVPETISQKNFTFPTKFHK